VQINVPESETWLKHSLSVAQMSRFQASGRATFRMRFDSFEIDLDQTTGDFANPPALLALRVQPDADAQKPQRTKL
jgi:hypothetical protein